MEAQAEALRAALVKLDEIEALMDASLEWWQESRRPLRDLRIALTLSLHEIEYDMLARFQLGERERP